MQRVATRQSRAPNAEEKRWHAWLKQRPCAVTGLEGVQVHHCVGATGRHNKVLIGHVFCLPLAPHIHDELHSAKRVWIETYGQQCDIFENEYEQYCWHVCRAVFVKEHAAIMSMKI